MTAEPVRDGLDAPCPVCGQVSGDHTLREWTTCLGRTTTDLAFEEIPSDTAAAAAEHLRRSFGIDGDVVIADHVVVKALTLDGCTGPVRVRLPALLHEFAVGIGGRPPVTVAKVLYVGGEDAIRAYGRLVRDSSNGAVNAAGRGR